MRTTLIFIAAAATALTGGCANDPRPEPASSHPPAQLISANSNAPSGTPPPRVAQERACGAFTVIDHLAHDAITPAPGPANPKPAPNGSDVNTYASALQTLDRQGVSSAMNAALTAHAYTLSNLGALINHHSSQEDIASMTTVIETTARTVQALCEQTP